MADGCDELLERAAAVYSRGVAQHRDALLETGRLLHEFILAGLTHADGLPRHSNERRTAYTRKALVQRAAGRLGVGRKRVNELVGAWAAVSLLGGGTGLGSLCHGSLTYFRAFVERRRGVGEARAGTRGGPRFADLERWAPKPRLEGPARELLRRAAADGYCPDRVRGEVARLLGGRSRRRPPRPPSAWLETGRRWALAGAPGDVADLLWQVLKDAPDPLAVVHRLRALALAPRRPSLYEQEAV